MNMITTLVPEWKDFTDLAVYCFEVNGYRIKARCRDKVTYKSLYQYDFTSTDFGVNANPECTGEISPLRGYLDLVDEESSRRYTSFSLRVWPKTDLGMAQGGWNNPEKIKADILDFFGRYADKFDHLPNYVYPKQADDIDILTIKDRLWGHVSCGTYRDGDMFCTELTEHLVIMVDFDASPCWPRDALPPADIKSHVMDFFLDYLEHFDIIPLGSVPDEELPPLGFYPSQRDEKEIDADGQTIEQSPDSSINDSDW
jgi:hypothetical protein